jgi:putative phage-type endonuclease
MKQHNLVQGSKEWLAHRTAYRNASEAPAMMGCSPYMTRDELLQQTHTGLTQEVDAGTQGRFDEGHQAEEKARPRAEAIIGQDLYPVVGTNGNIGASFDGITMAEEIIFEHKLMNESIREAIQSGQPLPLHYRVQMEQQLYVSGAEKCLFMATKWNGDELLKELYCWYYPDLELREQILEGWNQFSVDLAEYAPPEVHVKAIGRTPDNLPALNIEVTGMVMASNLTAYRDHALAVFASINRKLETDQHFADSEKAIKWCGDVEKRIESAKQHALSQTETIDLLFNALDSIRDEARNVRLELEKLVKARKEAIRLEIVQEGQKALAEHITAQNIRIGKAYMPTIAADFNGAIKGKKTIESLRNAVNTVVANAKIEANQTADRIDVNLKHLNEAAKDYMAAFPDVASIVTKPVDDFQAVVALRVTKAKEDAEAARAKAIKDADDLEKSEIARLAALNTTLIQEAPVSQQVITSIAGNPPYTIATSGVQVNRISARRKDLNDHLDTLTDDELERVLRFCQSRYPLQQAA